MKQVDIRTRTVPNRPRSGNYPTGSTVSVGGGGSSSTIINEGGGMDLAEARKHFLSRTNDDTAAGIINFSKGLRILSDLINKLFKENTEGDMSDESIMTSLRVLKEIADNNDKLKELFLRKDQEDTTNYLINLLGGVIAPFIQSPDFVSGMMGTGFTLKRDADGTTYAEIDRLLVQRLRRTHHGYESGTYRQSAVLLFRRFGKILFGRCKGIRAAVRTRCGVPLLFPFR